MRRAIQRRTVYAATLITILALAGGWTFAATLVTSNPPPQSSSITVIAPGAFTTATVESTELVSVTSTIAALGPAGTQAPAGAGGLNSTKTMNAVLPQCSATPGTCGGNYSAVDVAQALVEGDVAVQVSLQVTQGSSAVGFDVQVELILGSGAYVFGNGYFDSNTNSATSTIWVMLFIDTGVSALTPPTLAHVVVTMNACTQATSCP